MTTLVIYAHPNSDGHNKRILKETLSSLKKRSINYQLIDLYNIKFQPVLQKHEHYTAGGFKLDDQIKDFQNQIKNAQKLIFIFPLWWNGPPAILKGFIDRVFTNRFGFKYMPLPFKIFGMEARPMPLLKGKKAAILFTSGSLAWQYKLFLGSRGHKVFCKDNLGFCGIKAKAFQVDKATKITKEQEKKIKKKVRKALKWLF